MVGLDWLLDLDFFFITFLKGQSQNSSSAQKCAPGGLGAAAAAAAAAAASQKRPCASQKRPVLSWGIWGHQKGPKTPLWGQGGAPLPP